ncbi:dihydrofolate reductase family protein [Georgenia sp. Z1491]|uniref:dihydrofolate reductase family protein n=1 Tax=Georgenia sp. Z1491 TaxID=3416707 RepID=UPI003CE8ACA8
MGRLIYSMQVSLDGYVQDENGDFSWAAPEAGDHQAMNDAMADVGTYLMGRKMYEMMHVWETDPAIAEEGPEAAEFAQIWQRADKIVFSTTLAEPITARTGLRRTFDPDEIRALKEASDEDLTIDGPTLAAHALRHGLVDAVMPVVYPVSIGSGLRFLPDGVRLDLALRSDQVVGRGIVFLEYEVLHGRD